MFLWLSPDGGSGGRSMPPPTASCFVEENFAASLLGQWHTTFGKQFQFQLVDKRSPHQWYRVSSRLVQTVYFFFLPLPLALGEFCRTADVDSSFTLSKLRAGCQRNGLRRYIGHGGKVIWTNNNSIKLFSLPTPKAVVARHGSDFTGVCLFVPPHKPC